MVLRLGHLPSAVRDQYDPAAGMAHRPITLLTARFGAEQTLIREPTWGGDERFHLSKSEPRDSGGNRKPTVIFTGPQPEWALVESLLINICAWCSRTFAVDALKGREKVISYDCGSDRFSKDTFRLRTEDKIISS